jgi:hypothetical protein
MAVGLGVFLAGCGKGDGEGGDDVADASTGSETSGNETGTGDGTSTTGTDTTDTDDGTDSETDTGGLPPDPNVDGEYMRWHVLTFHFDGPASSEDAADPNPFVDYRLQIHLESPEGQQYVVPGFFAGDGEGGADGDQWHARFRADEIGVWNYDVEFVAGDEVALDLTDDVGTPEDPDGHQGQFEIIETDKVAPDFRATGRLVYADDHYLRTQTGDVWIKGGADSPENFLGYAGFDNTLDQTGGAGTSGLMDGVHRYAPHVDDWNQGDPDWGAQDGRGIIGALNYLAEAHVNSIYFLPCNLGGDGRETYPYLDPTDLEHIDLSKVEQWELVLRHAQELGIALHFVLNETESGNENLHDGGTLGPQRMLFYRELVARFGHHLGVFWNIGEENDYGATRQVEFATYIRAQDPVDHPTTVHTHANNPGGQYNNLVGNENFDITSIQLSPNNAGQYAEDWRTNSAAANRPWVVMLDEIGPAGTGVTDQNAAQIRRLTLWPAYLSGSGGVEWYFGYHDLPLGGDMRTENFRTRADMWDYTWIARQFLADLPLPQMDPDDSLLSGANGHVFAEAGSVYAIYLPDGGSASLDLTGQAGDYELRWYDVATGEWSAASDLAGGSVVALGAPAYSGDVAAVVAAK